MSWICGAVGSPGDPRQEHFIGNSPLRMASYGVAAPAPSGSIFVGSTASDACKLGPADVIVVGSATLGGTSQSAKAILDLYRRDAEILDRLRGNFALALYDGTSNHLHLLRDAIGDHPLFYLKDGTLRAFASLPSGLFPLTGGKPDLDGLAAQRGGPLTGNRTPFESIRRILPGEHVVLKEGAQERYFPSVPPAESIGDALDTTIVEEVRALLDQAVQRTIPSDGQIACHLSSGRDSSAVTATAARLAPERIVAFTGAPATGASLGQQKARAGDESEAAEELAATLGIEQHTIRDDQSLFAPLETTARVFQTMMHPLSNLGWMAAINRAAEARGARSLLVGSMGNLTLNAGGLPALQDHLRAGRPFRWAREYRRAAARPDVSWKGALAASVTPWLPEWVAKAAFEQFGDYRFPDPDRFIRPEFRNGQTELPDLYAGRTDWRANAARGYLLADPGLRRIGLLGRYGMTERDPLADRDLAERLLSLPAKAFLDNGRFRPLADSVLSDRLPATVLATRTRGLQSADWLDRFDPAEALMLIEECRTSTAVTDFLDIDALRREAGAIKAMKSEGFGRQIGQGWHLMEALQIASFLYQLDRHPDDFGRF